VLRFLSFCCRVLLNDSHKIPAFLKYRREAAEEIISSHYFFSTFVMALTLNAGLTFCTFCEEVPTRHCCMHLVEKGGLATNGDLCICGEYICAPCSLSFGSEEKGYSAVWSILKGMVMKVIMQMKILRW
jgi:hypothetical protein